VFENAVGLFAYYVFIFAFLWFAVHWLTWRIKKSPLENGKMQGIGILLLTVLIFDLPFMISINYIERHFIPFVPFLAILGAFFIDEVLAFANSRG
jgi:predicted MPP superfamily phosphohydrolase